MAGLRCTKIEHLSLCCPGLLTVQLADLLPRLPRLRALGLSELHIDSLTVSFLALQPMAQQHSSPSLVLCSQLPFAELRHVHALKGLQSLVIIRSFTAPLDVHSRWLLTPPSVALPRLADFEYTAP